MSRRRGRHTRGLERSDFTPTSYVEKFLALATRQRIIRHPCEVLFEVSFDPLAKFEVVLVFGFHQLRNVDVPLDPILLKGTLKHFVILDELVFMLGTPPDPTEGEGARVEAVHHATVDSASCALLDLADPQLPPHKH